MRFDPIDRGPRLAALLGVVLAAALARLAPHPWNFTPIAALALFGGAHFRNGWLAFGVPLGAMVVSDAVLGLAIYGGEVLKSVGYVYAAFALTVCLGRLVGPTAGVGRVGSSAVGAALLFYLVTNFGVWLWGSLYPPTLDGLAACYVAALPFLRNALMGNLFYCAVLFGGLRLMEHGLPSIRPVHAGALEPR